MESNSNTLRDHGDLRRNLKEKGESPPLRLNFKTIPVCRGRRETISRKTSPVSPWCNKITFSTVTQQIPTALIFFFRGILISHQHGHRNNGDVFGSQKSESPRDGDRWTLPNLAQTWAMLLLPPSYLLSCHKIERKAVKVVVCCCVCIICYSSDGFPPPFLSIKPNPRTRAHCRAHIPPVSTPSYSPLEQSAFPLTK
jgi:hypothetical protein